VTATLTQFAHLLLALALAPALTGLVRRIKARLLGRRGPPIRQPFRDLIRLARKETVLAENASWIYRVAPYLVFAVTLVVVGLIPTISSEFLLSGVGDLVVIVGLLATARFFLALAGLDVGTAFGGIGSSRDMMIASLAEPAMLMLVFGVALVAGSTSLPQIQEFVLSGGVGIEVSLALALLALIMVAIAENGRIPVDNPATHLELTMVHEAMVLEYSGRHLALIEAAAMLRLLAYASLIGAIFVPWGTAQAGDGWGAIAAGTGVYLVRLAGAAALLAAFETSIAKMRVFRVVEFLGVALMFALLAVIFRFVSNLF
jgi:formate hydrogenlyase subunit 4